MGMGVGVRKGFGRGRGRGGTIPEIVRAVFIRDEEDGDCGVGVRGVDAVSRRGVMFSRVQCEGFLEGLAAR